MGSVRTITDEPAGRAAGAESPGVRRPGRPRSEQADRAIIDAVHELFAESGISGVCVEAVAARAGVSKATIYRRWPGKEDLLVDALAALKTPLPEPGGESVREDLVTMLTVMCRDAADPCRARQWALVLGEGEKYPRLMQRYTAEVVEPRRDMLRSVLRSGVATGEIRRDADVEVAMLALTGAVLARGKHDPPQCLTQGFAERVVDQALTGLAPR